MVEPSEGATPSKQDRLPAQPEPHSSPQPPRHAGDGIASRSTSFLGTEEGVYGVILVAGMIVVSNSYDSIALLVFVTVVSTVVVFWAAHVFAGTIAHHDPEGRVPVSLRLAFRSSLHRAWGLLVSALVPCILLLLGALHVVSDEFAISAALWTCVGVLAILGYLAFLRRGSSFPVRILGTLATAGFGVIMILLKAAVH